MITVLVIVAILLALFAIIRAPNHDDLMEAVRGAEQPLPPPIDNAYVAAGCEPCSPPVSLMDTPITIVLDYEELDAKTRDFSLRGIEQGHAVPDYTKNGTKFGTRFGGDTITIYEKVILQHTTLRALLTSLLEAQDLQFEDGQDAVESTFTVGPNVPDLRLDLSSIFDRTQGFKLI
jgi:hypothetical protein